MNKVALYGHLIIDQVFSNFKNTTSIGGIANVWDSLLKLNNKLVIDIIPTAIGNAIIIVNTNCNTRIGRANFNLETHIPKIVKADWNHIAYLNQLNDISFISNLVGIISADLSKETPEKVVDSLKYLDYLFLSKEDLFMDILELAKLTKGWVVAHDPLGSIYSDGKTIYQFNIPAEFILHNINVLGAGDMFAACFINNILQKNDIHESILNSHKQTTELLKENIL
jgi:hypothetical protein